jgi:hypothetical protein
MVFSVLRARGAGRGRAGATLPFSSQLSSLPNKSLANTHTHTHTQKK